MRKFILSAIATSFVATPVLAAPYNGQDNRGRIEQRHDDRGSFNQRNDDRGRFDRRDDRGSQRHHAEYRKWKKGDRLYLNPREIRAHRFIQPGQRIHGIAIFKNVDPRLQKGPWYTVKDVHYGVPYLWGPNVLMYNTDAFKDKAPTSWKVVFEEETLPDGKSNKGRVQAYDGPIYVADAALYLMAHKPELGIKDPYELNEDQYKAALDLLRGQRKLVSRYWHDAMIQIDDFKNEGVVASGSWPFQVNLMQADKQKIASTFPEEGATGWADTTMLHVDSEHPNCAYMWMEHSLQAKVQGDAAAWFGAVPSVPAACKGNELLTDEGCSTNGYDHFDKIKFWRTPTAKCATQGECVPYHRWVSDYIGVIGGR